MVYSVSCTVKINRRAAAAVIDDTLARIRGIPGITVVNSSTREGYPSLTHALVDIEFKFLPDRDEREWIKEQLKKIKKAMKSKPFVDEVIIKYHTVRKVE